MLRQSETSGKLDVSTEQPPKHSSTGREGKEAAINEPRWGLSGPLRGFYQVRLAWFPVSAGTGTRLPGLQVVLPAGSDL